MVIPPCSQCQNHNNIIVHCTPTSNISTYSAGFNFITVPVESFFCYNNLLSFVCI